MNDDLKKIKEAAFENMIGYAGTKAADELFDEIEKSMSDSEIVFSEEHSAAVRKILDNEKNALQHKRGRRIKTRFLIAAVIVTALLLMSILTVSAVKKKIRKKHIRNTGYSTEIEYSSDDDSLVNEKFGFNVDYVPVGFDIKTQYSSKIENHIRYENGTKYFEVSKISAVRQMAFDSENAEVSELIINESEAMMFVKNGETTITWENIGYIYWIMSDLDSKDVIKIAESIY